MWWIVLECAFATSGVIPLSARWTAADGSAPSASQAITVRLYADTNPATSAAWTETRVVLMEGGAFTVMLGEVTPLTLEWFADNPGATLTVSDGVSETARVSVGFAPRAAYAVLAGDSRELGGRPAADYVTRDDGVAWSKLTSVPNGLADGDDDTRYSPGSGLTLTGTTFAVNSAVLTPTWLGVSGRPAGLDDGDDDTRYSPGSGLTLTGTTFAVNSAVLTPTWLGVSGRPAGLDDGDDDTRYSPGVGLSLSGTTFSVNNAALAPAWSAVTGRPAGLDDGDNDTTYTAGPGIALTAGAFSLDQVRESVQRRIERYQETCMALARANGWSGNANVAAVTPNSETAVLTGNQVCANYVGNNSQATWTCIGVPYVYDYHRSAAGYVGTDVRPTWRDCATRNGPNLSPEGSYPWLNVDNYNGVMMACCVK